MRRWRRQSRYEGRRAVAHLGPEPRSREARREADRSTRDRRGHRHVKLARDVKQGHPAMDHIRGSHLDGFRQVSRAPAELVVGDDDGLGTAGGPRREHDGRRIAGCRVGSRPRGWRVRLPRPRSIDRPARRPRPRPSGFQQPPDPGSTPARRPPSPEHGPVTDANGRRAAPPGAHGSATRTYILRRGSRATPKPPRAGCACSPRPALRPVRRPAPAGTRPSAGSPSTPLHSSRSGPPRSGTAAHRSDRRARETPGACSHSRRRPASTGD